MARANNKARLLASVQNLTPTVAGQLADLLESIAGATGAEDIGEIETSVRSSRRKARAEAAAAEKPARRSRRAKAEAEDEKPTRRRRGAAKAEADEKPARRTRKPKVEIELLADDVTVDDLFEILENFEGEPVAGTMRDLKPLVEAYGVDAKEFLADIDGTAKEKAEELGMLLAGLKALEAQIVATLKDNGEAMDEIIEELDLELRETARPGTVAKAIIVAMHEDAAEAEDEDGEDEAEDEVEEVAPRRRRRAKAEDEDEKPARKSRRAKAKAADEDEDELDDLDDLDD